MKKIIDNNKKVSVDLNVSGHDLWIVKLCLGFIIHINQDNLKVGLITSNNLQEHKYTNTLIKTFKELEMDVCSITPSKVKVNLSKNDVSFIKNSLSVIGKKKKAFESDTLRITKQFDKALKQIGGL